MGLEQTAGKGNSYVAEGQARGQSYNITSLCSEAVGYREIAPKPILASAGLQERWRRRQSIFYSLP